MPPSRIDSLTTFGFTAADNDDRRVIRFRPRGGVQPDRLHGLAWQGDSAAAKSDRAAAADDAANERGNLLAIVIVVALMAIGSWVISSMIKLDTAPQCVLTDGNPCPPFYVPAPRNHYRASLIPSLGRS